MTRMAWMRRGAGIAALGVVTAAWLTAQTANRANEEFYQFQSINGKFVSEGVLRLTVLGNPAKADFRTQKMKVSARKFLGDVSSDAQKAMTVLSATLTGDAQIIAARPSSNAASKEVQNVTIDTETIVFDGKANQATATSAITVIRSDPGAGETMRAKGSSGKAVLFPAGQTGRSALKSMHLAGPVQLRLESQVVENGKSALRKIVADANSMDYDDSTGKILLNGNVRITGDHPILFGDIVAQRVILTLNAKGEIDEIDVYGDPVTTNLDRKPPPGAKR